MKKKRFSSILQDEYIENKKYSFLDAGFSTINHTLLGNLQILIVLWYGGYIATTAVEEGLSRGDLASFILYSTSLASNLATMSDRLGTIIPSMAALQRIFEMLQYEPTIKFKDEKNGAQWSGQIQFQEVKFSYPSTNNEVLHGINFSVSPGECAAFVGTSGSGKSTIIKLIERFYDATSGSILLDSQNIKEINEKNLRNSIALVNQEPVLFSGSILDNIVYGVDKYSMNEVNEICDICGVRLFLEDKQAFPMGYQTLVGEKGTKLSVGQKQRIGIARALMKQPKILILDESTSALDAQTEYQVQSNINKLMSSKKKNITIIIIAHRLSTILKCNKIFVMKSGEIVEKGNHQELIDQDGIYKQLVEKQLLSIS